MAQTAAPTPARPRRDLLTAARFVAAGSAGNVVYSLAFLALAQSTDSVTVPSVIASTVSTLAVNEAHRLWTFRGIGRPTVLQAHLSGAASALVGTGLTAVVLLAWTWVFPGASLASDVALSWGVTALVGTVNFLHLRRAAAATSSHGRPAPGGPRGALPAQGTRSTGLVEGGAPPRGTLPRILHEQAPVTSMALSPTGTPQR